MGMIELTSVLQSSKGRCCGNRLILQTLISIIFTVCSGANWPIVKPLSAEYLVIIPLCKNVKSCKNLVNICLETSVIYKGRVYNFCRDLATICRSRSFGTPALGRDELPGPRVVDELLSGCRVEGGVSGADVTTLWLQQLVVLSDVNVHTHGQVDAHRRKAL